MTAFSVAEVRAVLAEVGERLGAAYRSTQVAHARIADAIAAFAELDRTHPESLLPAELTRADDVLAGGLEMISRGASAVAAIDARL